VAAIIAAAINNGTHRTNRRHPLKVLAIEVSLVSGLIAPYVSFPCVSTLPIAGVAETLVTVCRPERVIRSGSSTNSARVFNTLGCRLNQCEVSGRIHVQADRVHTLNEIARTITRPPLNQTFPIWLPKIGYILHLLDFS
jgi:hypothetical protein